MEVGGKAVAGGDSDLEDSIHMATVAGRTQAPAAVGTDAATGILHANLPRNLLGHADFLLCPCPPWI